MEVSSNQLADWLSGIAQLQQRGNNLTPEQREILSNLIQELSLIYEQLHAESRAQRARDESTLQETADLKETNTRLQREIEQRQRTEEKLSEVQEYLHMMIENVRDYAIFSLDMDNRFTTWNSGAERMFGYTEAEILGQSGALVFTPEDRANQEPEKELAIASLTGAAEDERWHLRKDGSRFFASGMTRVMLDATGSKRGFVKVARDITERRQAEAKLREREVQLRRNHDTFYHLIQNTPFGVYVVDADFRLRQVSLGAEKVFSSVHPLIGRDFAEVLRIIWPEPFATEAINRFRHTLETGEPYNSPNTVERRQDIRQVEAYDWRIERITLPDGRFGVVCYFYDLTERQQWENALRESEQRLAEALNTAHMAVWDWDPEADTLTVSESASDVFGLLPGQTITSSKDRSALLHPEDRVPQRIIMGHAGKLGENWHWEFRIIRPRDGQTAWLEERATARREPETGKIHLTGLVWDITERKLLELQRVELLQREQAARQEAERAVSIQQLFLGMISHELRTPLASIKGFSSTLLAEDITFTPEQISEFVKIIDEEADKLQDLIEQLMDVVQMQAGTFRVEPAPVPLKRIIAKIMPQLQILVAEHVFEVSIPDDLPQVYADNQRIGQVLVNLVGNAAKFSPSGTRITVSAQQLGDFVEVTVSDQGRGIPLAEHTSVFEVFRQVHADTPLPRGVGLGLTICKGLVEAHGGTIWIDDQPQPGTTVSFTLPIFPQDTYPAAQTDTPESD